MPYLHETKAECLCCGKEVRNILILFVGLLSRTLQDAPEYQKYNQTKIKGKRVLYSGIVHFNVAIKKTNKQTNKLPMGSLAILGSGRLELAFFTMK